MAAELGGSQISALLESVPGIANVLRSPVADAMVNLIRAAGGAGEFDYADAEELVQYAVRRGLINGAEGEHVLDDVRVNGRTRRSNVSKSKGKTAPAKPRKPAGFGAKGRGRPVKKPLKVRSKRR